MKFTKLAWLVSLVLALTLAACGGGAGPKLGDFPSLNKTEGDAPFTLSAPTSDGPGSFTFTSSDTAVATISGNTVTIVNAGITTITATQAAVGSYRSSTTSAVLTVSPRICITPATRQNGLCVAPIATGNNVVQSNRTWMPVSFIDTWTNANAYCTTTTIGGLSGWRLPTSFELSELYTSGVMNSQGWILSATWSSTVAPADTTTLARRKTVRLDNGVVSDDVETDSGAYVACVR